MAKTVRPLLLVGGIPGDSVEGIMRAVAPVLGDRIVGLPDGEPGVRRMWVGAVAARVWSKHPGLQLVRVPRGAEGLPDGVPADYDDFWIYRTQPGVASLEVQTLHYPEDAAAAYPVFRRLREEGLIAEGVRFQFGFPFPEDACREFTDNAADLELMIDAYLDAVQRDIDAVCRLVPHDDLLLQWEINWETLAVEHGDFLEGRPPLDYHVPGDPMERYCRYMAALSQRVPETVMLGMHFCYGDLHHRHFSNPPDLSTAVRMANAAYEFADRPIDYVHMPVPADRSDDRFFEPLSELRIGGATLYAGLLHYSDGVAGSLARLAVCRRHYKGALGVATECGMGRRPADQSPRELLDIHREVASAL